MMEHTCRLCKRVLPESSYRVRKDRSNYRIKSCRKCERVESETLLSLHKTAPPKPVFCECCGKEKPLQLDHCHKTVSFRGWLCNTCNQGIGKLGDNIEGLEMAIRYLRRKVNHDSI